MTFLFYLETLRQIRGKGIVKRSQNCKSFSFGKSFNEKCSNFKFIQKFWRWKYEFSEIKFNCPRKSELKPIRTQSIAFESFQQNWNRKKFFSFSILKPFVLDTVKVNYLVSKRSCSILYFPRGFWPKTPRNNFDNKYKLIKKLFSLLLKYSLSMKM